jgi:hypothetical protein
MRRLLIVFDIDNRDTDQVHRVRNCTEDLYATLGKPSTPDRH